MVLWKVTTQTFIGEPYNPLLNVFGYQSNVVIADEANELMDSVVAHLIPAIIAVQSVECFIGSLEVLELNGTGYGFRSFSSTAHPGARAGIAEPPFVAWSFKIVRGSQGERSGGKRFGLISTDDVVNRGHGSAVGAAIDALAAQIIDPLPIALVDTWFPVILERPVAPSTTWSSHSIGGCFFEAVSTQNSRKK